MQVVVDAVTRRNVDHNAHLFRTSTVLAQSLLWGTDPPPADAIFDSLKSATGSGVFSMVFAADIAYVRAKASAKTKEGAGWGTSEAGAKEAPFCGRSGRARRLSGGDPPNPPCSRRGGARESERARASEKNVLLRTSLSLPLGGCRARTPPAAGEVAQVCANVLSRTGSLRLHVLGGYRPRPQC
jgi:hypothetical protein